MTRGYPKERPDYFTLNPDSTLAQGLVAFYGGRFAGGDRCDDATESLWGGGNPGTLTGFDDPGAAWGRENGRACVTFDGTDDSAECGNNESLQITGELTLAVRVVPHTPMANAGIISKYGGNTDQGYLLFMFNGAPAVIIPNDATGSARALVYPAASLPLNASTHLAAVYDGATVTVWRDGVVVASADYSLGCWNSSVDVSVGRWGTNYFDGDISDPVIARRAYSADEIKALADPANFLLRIGATDLIKSVRRMQPTAVADTAKPWLYRRSSRIIGGGVL